ncbi:hypothetical protein [Paenibacillus eucommiae]|uniref:Alpha-L-rhamnosidase six-hairpin glycosidase domain-containing protein n=1 Tax=Paenibacillus eucommiae TaxID=1355755 RepID=A0ABS4IMG6_9BACL|nr:hypothetical protein [Paenibacillus eucommiae]MBP1988758.1 hypothetical protein [Paenibacillus eucommiae]
MTTEISVSMEWKQAPAKALIRVSNGLLLDGEVIRGDGRWTKEHLFVSSGGACRLNLVLKEQTESGTKKTIVTIETGKHAFSFFLKDVCKRFPIFIPAYGAAVTETEDGRTYEQIEQNIRQKGLVTYLQQMEQEPEESFEEAARHTRSMTCQTWLGTSRDVRIFELGFRGINKDELQWDWVQPRYYGEEVKLPENEGKAVRYHFLLGRGIGCTDPVTRRLEDGVLPIAHTEIADGGIVYKSISFVSMEHSGLRAETLKGTHYLVADGFGFGHMLTAEQESQRQKLLDTEMIQEEETVFYFRVEAVNNTEVPRYAWFKNVIPNGWTLGAGMEYEFDRDQGFAQYGTGRVFAVSLMNGKPMACEEQAILIMPGDKAVYEFRIPHQPVSEERARKLQKQNFSAKHEECRVFWQEKLASSAQVTLPEKRIEEMLQAGLLHLDLVTYGLERRGTLVPSIGVYTAIGSESSPIIQFMDVMGWHDTARRSLQFFFDKQHENGFMQNFGGYMLETGAVLWCVGEHYRYTRDEAWIRQIKPGLLKAYHYLLAWRHKNKTAELRDRGYGMLEGKTADPEDPYHSFMLNGYAYLGLSRLAEVLTHSDPDMSANIRQQAEALKRDICTAFTKSMANSPVVPLGDGSWVPSSPPWVEDQAPLSLYAEAGKWMTHGSILSRDSLLGPLYLIFQEVISPNEEAASSLLQYHTELMFSRNVGFSQPYYSIHPWVHLKRGEVKPFLKAYYNGFAGLADRETYTFWEHYWHASPHKTHEEAWFLMQTRWMLYMEDGQTLRLLPGVPRQWLEDGKVIELRNAVSYYGPITLRVESQSAKGVIIATLECASGRMPAAVVFRLPHPTGGVPNAVFGGIYDKDTESVRIEAFTGKAEIKLQYEVLQQI